MLLGLKPIPAESTIRL